MRQVRIGIVGSEAAKFTPEAEQLAREQIRLLIESADVVVSGGCHLGGIDIWAKEEGLAMGLEVVEHLPVQLQWSPGYKERNIKIAEDSTAVYCLTVRELPPGYPVKGFERYCYHCGTDQHIKSGGCWTTKYARKVLKKIGLTFVVG